MLEHDNPFWRFSLRLYGIERIKHACLRLQDECQANVNLLLFAIWAAQQHLRFLPDRAHQQPQLEAWHQDYTCILRRQRRQLKVLADKGEPDEKEGLLHQMKQLIAEAELLSEKQEQAMLYFHYRQRQGLTPCEDRQAALIENLARCLAADSSPDPETLHILLAVVLDDAEAAEASMRIIEFLAHAHPEAP